MEIPDTIIIIFSDLGLGGIQTKIIDIINYIGENHPKTVIHLLLRRKGPFDKCNLLNNANIKFHIYENGLPLSNNPIAYTIYALWMGYLIKPKAILSFLSPFGLPSILIKIIFFWRKIHVVINEDQYTSAAVSILKYSFINTLGIRLLYPLADTIIVPTNAVRKDLIRSYNIPENKLRVISNWTTIVANTDMHNSKSCDIVYAGRIEKSKQVISIIHTVLWLKKLRKNIICRIYGSGTEKISLAALSRKRGLTKNIIFCPPVLNICEVIPKAKIFIFPSKKRGEGFPIAILEAMALGVPVITSDFLGVSEIIQHNHNGYIFHSSKELFYYCNQILIQKISTKNLIQNAKYTISNYCNKTNIGYYCDLLNLSKVT